jgi:hypothetical protein
VLEDRQVGGPSGSVSLLGSSKVSKQHHEHAKRLTTIDIH